VHLRAQRAAGRAVAEVYERLADRDGHLVEQLLRGRPFVEYQHYPRDRVIDAASAGQYFFHAHRDGEVGHFHVFMGRRGMPAGVRPLVRGQKTRAHLVAIAVDAHGLPTHLFAPNRWATEETFYAADDVCRMIDAFAMDATRYEADRWLAAMLRLYRPQIAELLATRDRKLARLGDGATERRDVEIVCTRRIDVVRRIAALG